MEVLVGLRLDAERCLRLVLGKQDLVLKVVDQNEAERELLQGEAENGLVPVELALGGGSGQAGQVRGHLRGEELLGVRCHRRRIVGARLRVHLLQGGEHLPRALLHLPQVSAEKLLDAVLVLEAPHVVREDVLDVVGGHCDVVLVVVTPRGECESFHRLHKSEAASLPRAAGFGLNGQVALRQQPARPAS